MLYDDSSYGIMGYEQFQKKIIGKHICLAFSKELLVDDTADAYYDKIISQMLMHERARGMSNFIYDDLHGMVIYHWCKTLIIDVQNVI